MSRGILNLLKFEHMSTMMSMNELDGQMDTDRYF